MNIFHVNTFTINIFDIFITLFTGSI